ncbi:glycoside hydrolase family 88 protein [Neobacillus sp. KR4-4]|uniref:glycoside hydrolase family 88 protein n=1 Tax=Neobacillus sp. KR4-4 TaxID=3344872 RepID=UPI0035CBCDEB
MVLQGLTFILLFLALVIVIIDLVPIFKDWISRIRIGNFHDKLIWNKTIIERGAIWIGNTPKIKVTDNTRLIVIDMLKRNYSKSAIQHWQEASLILGLAEYLKYNDDPKVKNELQGFLDRKFDSNGDWKIKPEKVDGAILAYSIMKINFIDIDKYKKALDSTWELIQEHIGQDGTVQYRKSMKSYRYVDTIGFICPFLISYGLKYHKEECIELAVKQIKTYEKHGMLDDMYIPCHSYNIENKIPLGLYGWGRGLGWYAIGLIDAWSELPNKHKYKLTLDYSIEKFAQAAIRFQQKNGSWNWTVTRSECRPDSSTTSTLAWFLLNASAIDSISDKCNDSANKAINYLMSVTRRNGSIDFSQGDTKDIGVYSSLFNILPFTQGFSIRCMNRYLQNSLENSKTKKVNRQNIV